MNSTSHAAAVTVATPVTSSGGNTVSLKFCNTAAVSNPGQYTIDTFTAGATTQAITLNGTPTGSGALNISATAASSLYPNGDMSGYSGAMTIDHAKGKITASLNGGAASANTSSILAAFPMAPIPLPPLAASLALQASM